MLTLHHPPVSGFGDRFSAWLALMALAELTSETVLLSEDRWRGGRSTILKSKEANQAHDVEQAFSCWTLPALVRSAPTRGDSRLRPLDFGHVFGVRVALPRATPGFPQPAIPDLAAKAFAFHNLAPNLTLPEYLAAYRRVAAAVGVQPRSECAPPEWRRWQRKWPARSDAAAAAVPVGAGRQQQVLMCLHLRRGDAWGCQYGSTNHTCGLRPKGGHAPRMVRAASDGVRDKFDNLTRRALRNVMGEIDARRQANRTATTWLVLSDHDGIAHEYATFMKSCSSAQAVEVAPQGYTLASFLRMRDAHGIFQSSLRSWSSFSAVPALMGGVPIFGVNPDKFGNVVHFASKSMPAGELQFSAAKAGDAAAFVRRAFGDSYVWGRGALILH